MTDFQKKINKYLVKLSILSSHEPYDDAKFTFYANKINYYKKQKGGYFSQPGEELAKEILKFPERQESACYIFEHNTTNLLSFNNSCTRPIQYGYKFSIDKRYKWNHKSSIIMHAEVLCVKNMIDNNLINKPIDIYVSRAVCYVCWLMIKNLNIQRIFYLLPFELDFIYHEPFDAYKNIEIKQIEPYIKAKHKKYGKPEHCTRIENIFYV